MTRNCCARSVYSHGLSPLINLWATFVILNRPRPQSDKTPIVAQSLMIPIRNVADVDGVSLCGIVNLVFRMAALKVASIRWLPRSSRISTYAVSSGRHPVGTVSRKQLLTNLGKTPARARRVALQNPDQVEAVIRPMDGTARQLAGDCRY